MSHIDTLKVYREYIHAGCSPEQADQFTAILENSFMTKVKELKNDFVSNKTFTALSTVIFIIMTGIVGELWYLSKEVSILSRDMQEVKESIREIRNYIFK